MGLKLDKKAGMLQICIVLVSVKYASGTLLGEVNFNRYSENVNSNVEPELSIYNLDQQAHHIVRRSVLGGADLDISSSIEKLGDWSSKTDIRVADTIPHKLTFWATEDGTTDIKISIITKTTNGTVENSTVCDKRCVLSICSPRITSKGSRVSGLVPAEVDAIMESNEGDGRNDVATIEFDALTWSGVSGNGDPEDQIELSFDVIVHSDPAFGDDETYWVATGIEFNDKLNVWIGQSMFNVDLTANASLSSGLLPVMTLEGPDSLPIGTTGHWELNIQLSDAVNSVVVEVYSPLNTTQIMSICSITVGNTGDSYFCYDKTESPTLTFPEMYNETSINNTHSMAKLDLGSVVNTLFWDQASIDDSTNNITVHIAASFLNVSEAVPGQSYPLPVSLALDSSTVWAAEILVVLEDPPTYDIYDDVPNITLKTPIDELTWGSSTVFYMNITFPQNRSDNYMVEVAMPFNDSAILTICENSVEIYYVGKNFPCWSYSDILPVFASEVNDSANPDFMSLDLGYISNGNIGNETEDSTIVIKFNAKVVENHTAVSSGDELVVIHGLYLSGGTSLWVGDINITISDSINYQINQVPKLVSTYNLMNIRDASILYARGTTSTAVKLELPAPSLWPNVSISAQSSYQNGGIPTFHICGIDVLQVGQDIASGSCESDDFGGSLTEGDRVKVPRSAKYATSSLTLTIPNLLNGGYASFWQTVNNSIIYFAVSIQDAENGLLVNGNFYSFNVTIDYGGSDTIVEEIFLQYIDDVTPALSDEDTDPQFTLTESTHDTYTVPEISTFDIELFTTPRSIESYSVNVLLEDDRLSVCRIRVKNTGKNIPCVDPLHPYYRSTAEANVSCSNDVEMPYQCSQLDYTTLDLGQLNNYGQYARNSTNEMNNAVTVEVVLRAHPNFKDYIIASDEFTIGTGVSTGDTKIWMHNTTFNINMSPGQALTSYPEMSFYKLNNESQITKGSGATYVMKMYIPPGSTADYRFEFFAPANSTTGSLGKVSFYEAKVTGANWNLPCVNDTYYNHSKLTSDGGVTFDSAIVDLGEMTNTGEISGEIVDDKNLLTVEATIWLPPDSNAIATEKSWVAASAFINNDTIWVGTLEFEVTEGVLDSEASNETLELILTEESTVPVRIGERKRFTLCIATDMVTTTVQLNFIFPNDGTETSLTLVSPHISHIGTNFIFGEECKVVTTIDNSLAANTSQDENLEVDLGIVTNVGTSRRYQFLEYNYSDDMLNVTFDVVAAEHASHTNMSETNFTVQMKDSRLRVKEVTGQVVTLVSGDEEPELQINSVELGGGVANAVDIVPGDTVTVSVHFNHTWGSSAHAYSMILRVFVPTILQYTGYSGFQFQAPTVTYDSDKRVVSFQITEMFFSDNETFHLNFTFDSSSSLHVGSGEIHVVLPVDVTYNGPTSNQHKTNISVLEFDLFVPDCSYPLGLEHNTIHDCQISSSVENLLPSECRFNSVSGGWLNQARAAPFYKGEYFQVSFGNLTRITAIRLQPYVNSTSNESIYLNAFELKFSFQGRKWFKYTESASGNAKMINISDIHPGLDITSQDSVYLDLPEGAIEARYLRLIPKEASNGGRMIGFRAELYGCVLTEDVSIADICEADDDYSTYERGYLLNENDGTLYVCMVSNVDDYIKCSYTEDLGASWNAIPDAVININFLHLGSNKLYGLGRNKKSRMRSDDGGENWCTISDEEYEENRLDASNAVTVKMLPFFDWLLSKDDLFSEFGLQYNASVNFSVDTDGIYVQTSSSGSWDLVSYWFTNAWSEN